MKEEDSYSSPIGLIAGNGSLPLHFIEGAHKKGVTVAVVGHQGETSSQVESLADSFLWVKVGQVGKIIKFFRRARVQKIAFAGGIKRVNLFGGVRLDRTGFRILARARSVRDDALLREIAVEFERNGLEVIAPNVMLKDVTPREGTLSARTLTESERQDASIGWKVAKTLGQLDVGQAVVVFEGLVIAVEGIEGTDALIERAGKLTGGRGGVLVKVSKPQQDLRLDMPAVGVQTIENACKAGLSALVLEAHKTLLLDPSDIVKAANKKQFCIHAWALDAV